MLKIISGKYKGRIIPTQKNASYRPSTAKFREALFSILTSGKFMEDRIIENANILDVYSGTGSLAFEALSRGAISATLIDNNDIYLQSAKIFAEKIGVIDDVSFIKSSAINLPYANRKYNLVLMDPPYENNLPKKTIKSLIKSGWLEDKSYILLEVAKNEDIEEIDNITFMDERKYGNSKLIIMKYEKV